MAHERRGPVAVSDPHAALGDPRGANAAQHPHDELRRWQRDEILRLQQTLEDEIERILHELARDRNRWC